MTRAYGFMVHSEIVYLIIITVEWQIFNRKLIKFMYLFLKLEEKIHNIFATTPFLVIYFEQGKDPQTGSANCLEPFTSYIKSATCQSILEYYPINLPAAASSSSWKSADLPRQLLFFVQRPGLLANSCLEIKCWESGDVKKERKRNIGT